VLQLCRALRDRCQIAVVTNDLFTKEDAQFLVKHRALDPARIIGVETGACPHTAIREDVSVNEAALQTLQDRFGDLDLLLVESGGDNLAATFSPELVDGFIYIIDVAGGDKVPRKKGPGVIKCDLLIINKTDLAPYVGADLDVMARESRQVRGGRPFLFTNLRTGENLDRVLAWLAAWMKRPPVRHAWGKRPHERHAHPHV